MGRTWILLGPQHIPVPGAAGVVLVDALVPQKTRPTGLAPGSWLLVYTS